MCRTARAWVTAVVLLVAAGGARADTYYVVVFGAEPKPQRPKYSHSWATFVRIPGCAPCGPPAQIQLPNIAPIHFLLQV